MNVERYPKSWTHNEQKLLKELYAKGLTAKQIAEKVGRSEFAVYNRASKIGLCEKSEKNTRWVQAEDDFLIKNYSKCRMGYLIKRLGRTRGAIMARARFLKLRVQNEAIQTLDS